MGNTKQSAGLLMYRWSRSGKLKVLIAHPGGPIFAKKDAGHWGIPKGEFEADETPVGAAQREFEEETGLAPAAGESFIPLGTIVQKGGKTVHAWAFEGVWEKDRVLRCNEIDLEWPPLSGKWHRFPEIDEVRMVGVKEAERLMKKEQFAFVERLRELLSSQQKLDLS